MVSTRATPRSTKHSTPDIDPSDYSALTTRRTTHGRWSHTPSWLALGWLAVSLPLVVWDTGYVLLRPRTMPGGSLHWPLYTPYALYGRVDHNYGPVQWNAANGFPGAQGLLNAIETSMYALYLALWWRGARPDGSVGGRAGAAALLVGFSAAVMTLSKTLLYWLIEYYGNYSNIAHNSLSDLILLWIIPNGLWIVFPAILIYQWGIEIVDSLAASPGATKKLE